MVLPLIGLPNSRAQPLCQTAGTRNNETTHPIAAALLWDRRCLRVLDVVMGHLACIVVAGLVGRFGLLRRWFCGGVLFGAFVSAQVDRWFSHDNLSNPVDHDVPGSCDCVLCGVNTDCGLVSGSW